MTRKPVGIRVFAACLVIGLLCEAGGVAASEAKSSDAALARQILDATGIQGGLVVHLGCGDGKLTAALRESDAFLVQGLDSNAKNVEAARRGAQSLGIYGAVSFDRHDGEKLPYIDNLVNLLVVENANSVSKDEMLRVLAPEGAAYIKTDGTWTKIVKPRSKAIDQWTHYLYDPSNNAVSRDVVVGPPRHLQWLVEPKWSRHHDHMASLSAMVSAAGRVFYIMDEGPRDAILLPPKWMLVARDAYNGTLLWKRPIAEWNTHLWPLKSGPNQLPRRLVAVGDRVYVTLGIDAPLTALDAATGKTLHTYAGTDHTDEVLVSDGAIFLLVAHEPNKWKEYRPNATYVWDNTQRANRDWAWDGQPRSVVALKADGGETLWKIEHKVAPLTLTADAAQVYLYDGEKVVALSRADGKQVWASEPVTRKQPFPTGYGPTLVVQHGVVLLSVEQSAMTAFSAADGKTFWKDKHHRGGHASPDDMLVINGLVWSGAVASGADSGIFTGRDIRTGEIKKEFPPDVNPDWFHHRCYRSRATDKYFIASRTGLEYIDVEKQHWDINHWVRGGCLYGFMPANGLTYAPPHSCGCFLESKLFGLNALAAESPSRHVPREVPEEGRLEKGPAFGQQIAGQKASESQWPTYRANAARSGSVKASLSAELKQSWQVELSGKLSSPVAAEGRVFFAAIDRHTVHAMDAATGKPAWSYTVGGRVDSPPTIFEGRVLFGSADGCVYCLRAADGALVWRFRAAPVDRRLMAYEQVESAWPVSGSVLVDKGVVWCVAGRSAFLDGGMRLVRLEPATGRLLSEAVLDDRDPESGENLQQHIQGQDMPVALPDILSSDGASVYMRSQAFDLEGKRRMIPPVKMGFARRKTAEEAVPAEVGDHLFSRSGFLDDSWFWRSYWILGRVVNSNYGGWLQPGHLAPCGRLMVFNDKNVYGFDRKPEYLCNASVQEYYLYGADRSVSEESLQRVRSSIGRIDSASSKKSASSSDWALRKQFSLSEQNPASYVWAKGTPPIQARAMVLAGNMLFVAGPPDLLDEEEALRNYDDPAIQAKLQSQVEALQGRRGGQLLAVSATDGTTQAAYELGTVPTFDGMAAADGKLFLTTLDGRLICLADRGTALPAAAAPKLQPLDTSVQQTPVKAVSAEQPKSKPKAKAKSDAPMKRPEGPSLAKDFAKVVVADVLASELGYHLFAEGKLGFAVKKLPASLSGKVELKVKTKVARDASLANAFLVFGEKAEDANLVKAGLRYRMGKAVIVEGTMSGGKTAEQAVDLDEAKVYELRATIDTKTGQVSLETGGVAVTAKLEKPLASIQYAGFAAMNSAADFSEVEVVVKP